MFKKINFNNVIFFILIILIIFGTYKLLKKKFNLLESFELPNNDIETELERLTHFLEKDDYKIKKMFEKRSKKNIENLINICNIKIRELIVSLTMKNLKYQKVQIKYWTEIKELLEKYKNSQPGIKSKAMYSIADNIPSGGGFFSGGGDENEDNDSQSGNDNDNSDSWW